MKRQTTEWEEIFANHASNNRFYLQYTNNSPNPTAETDNSFRKQTKDTRKCSTKDTCPEPPGFTPWSEVVPESLRGERRVHSPALMAARSTARGGQEPHPAGALGRASRSWQEPGEHCGVGDGGYQPKEGGAAGWVRRTGRHRAYAHDAGSHQQGPHKS